MTIKEISNTYRSKFNIYISKDGKPLSEMEVVSLYKKLYGSLTTSRNKKRVTTSEIIDEMIQMGEIKRR